MVRLNYCKIPRQILYLIISGCLVPCPSLALSSDHNQVAKIKADSAEYNEKTGVSSYKGHIRADQGSTHLLADQIDVIRDQHNHIEKITAIGHPAKYQTLPDGKEKSVHAVADTIIYYPGSSKVILLGHAKVNQGPNNFSGSHIEYDMIAQRIVSFPNEHNQTTITLTPATV